VAEDRFGHRQARTEQHRRPVHLLKVGLRGGRRNRKVKKEGDDIHRWQQRKGY
jgi:hypothetical protein